MASSSVQKAQRLIAGCEACSDDAAIPFDNILDPLTASDPSVTDYFLETLSRCLQCGAEITEKTLVEWDGHRLTAGVVTPLSCLPSVLAL